MFSHSWVTPFLPTRLFSVRRCDPAQPFLNPTLVAGVNSGGFDRDPRLSYDELELFFTSDRGGSMGMHELYVSSRASRDDDFGTPMRIVEPASQVPVAHPFLASDNFTLYYTAALDIYVARRSSRNAPFGIGVPIANVNSAHDEGDPCLTQDEQVMYFSSARVQGEGYKIYRAARSVDGSFGTAVVVPELAAVADDGFPVLTPDGLSIYWATKRENGNSGDYNIWTAKRPSTTTAFSNPVHEGTVNSDGNAMPGWISADGCLLYISSDRSGSAGVDTWLARRPL